LAFLTDWAKPKNSADAENQDSRRDSVLAQQQKNQDAILQANSPGKLDQDVNNPNTIQR
jgi:hypothetical protein